MRRIDIVLVMAIGLSLVACGANDSDESPLSANGGDTVAPDSDSQDEDASEVAASDPRLPSTGDSYRDTAQEFALDVVQTYFDEDSTLFESMVHDPIYLAGTNTVYTRTEYLETMLDSEQFPAGQDYTNYTMDDYLTVYDPGVYTFSEASEEFGLPLFDEDGWVPQDDEFLFIGFFRTQGVPYSDEFMSISLVMFVVAERDGEWKVVGLIPHP